MLDCVFLAYFFISGAVADDPNAHHAFSLLGGAAITDQDRIDLTDRVGFDFAQQNTAGFSAADDQGALSYKSAVDCVPLPSALLIIPVQTVADAEQKQCDCDGKGCEQIEVCGDDGPDEEAAQYKPEHSCRD